MDNPEKLVTQGTQDKDKQNNGQSRETGNIGYTRRKQWDNPEKLVTQGTQGDDKQNNGQSRETGNIGYTRQ